MRKPKTQKGNRHNTGKMPVSLVFEARHAIEGAAQVLGGGLIEYGRSNWRNGLSHTDISDSLGRHFSAYLSGEDIDPKSGFLHVDMILCNAIFLAEMTRTHPELDMRAIVAGVFDKKKGAPQK